jgi:hypothetical protein
MMLFTSRDRLARIIHDCYALRREWNADDADGANKRGSDRNEGVLALSLFFLVDLSRDNPPDPRHPRSILRAAVDCDE